jgi:hypothetical protein
MRTFLVWWLVAIPVFCQVPSPVMEERHPASLDSLPFEIRQNLSLRKCFVPRYAGYTGQKDPAYIRGHFRSIASEDYAIVCHIPSLKVGDVLVYSKFEGAWRGEVIMKGTFDPSPAADKCETDLELASPAEIRTYARTFAPEEETQLKHLSLNHNGLEIGFCDKASVIYYFTGAKWIQLQGAD